MKTMKRLLLPLILITFSSLSYASKLFVSNNTSTISPEEAYVRVHGKAQSSLIRDVTSALQNRHYQQGASYSLLGEYNMLSTNTLTADNTFLFVTSPKQTISEHRLLETATFLAKKLKQESVAVFFDGGKKSVSDTTITFHEPLPTYAHLQDSIHRLTEAGMPAFSIYLSSYPDNLNDAKVSAIELLSTPNKSKELNGLFSNSTITSALGDALLVFQDGSTQAIN